MYKLDTLDFIQYLLIRNRGSDCRINKTIDSESLCPINTSRALTARLFAASVTAPSKMEWHSQLNSARDNISFREIDERCLHENLTTSTEINS
jgi:hypothetical protein